MGSGKSEQINCLLAGAVLDPVVDIDVFCFAENNDYEWLRPIASTLSTGDTADNVEACLAHLQGNKVGVLMVFTDRVHAALAAREGGNP